MSAPLKKSEAYPVGKVRTAFYYTAQVAPTRRSSGGAITAIIDWLQRRSCPGAYAPIINWPLCGDQ